MNPRDATEADYPEFARLFVELALPDPTPSTDWWAHQVKNALFLEEGGANVAYGIAFPLDRGLGYVMHVVVDPSVRNRGVGRALMNALGERLRARGCTEWSLSVMPSNTAAVALYRRCRMEIAYPIESLSMPWASVELLPREPIDCAALEPSRDAEVEATLGLPAGRITTARKMPDRVVFHADGGVIVFDPHFPGTPLFRAKTPAIARALLEAVAPSRKASGEEALRVNIEDHEALVKVLLALGATSVLSLVHMRGPI